MSTDKFNIIYEPAEAHSCDPFPAPTLYREGTIIECSECSKRYELVTPIQGWRFGTRGIYCSWQKIDY